MVQRLKGLSEQSQRALRLAARLGQRFELAQLARVCGVPPKLARDWLDAALRAGLLQPAGPGDAFQFVDATVQQAVADAAPEPADGLGHTALLQAQLEESNRRLQQQQQELQQFKAEAADTLRARTEFLANMGHRIRTPMSTIIGLSHLALKHQSDARQRNYLNQIRQSGEQLLALLNSMLDFSRIEAGQLELETIPFALDTVFETLAGLCAEKAAARGLELTWHIAPGVPHHLVGDPLRLGQMLIHYTQNGLRFTQRGEVEIAVSVVAQDPEAVKLRFDVRDTGIGLSATQIAGLYNDAAQPHSTGTQASEHGLALCRRLAGLMGGEVGVYSTPGAGSIFWFTASLGMGSAQTRPVLPGDLQHKRVLVVDDNANAAAMLCEQLHSLGCMAHGLVSGQAVLNELRRAALADTPYDALLTDWQMPEMDGLALVQRIQKMALASPPQVVLVTGYGRDRAGPLAARCGVFQLLQKPVSQALLYETLLDLLGLGEAAPQVPDVPALLQVHHASDRPARALLAPLRGARILLVEDNEINQLVAQEMLESEGFVVTLADNGQQALFRIDQSKQEGRPFDLVLMDMLMPVLDGVSAVRLIRSMPEYAQLPIVAMTAYAREADRTLCLRCGMNDFVGKPVKPQALWRALARWIQPRQGLGGPDRAN